MSNRRRTFKEEEKQSMAMRYESGEGLVSIAKDFGISISTLSGRLREWGVVVRRSGRPDGLTPQSGGWELMGMMPDGDLATKLGVSRQAVSQKRTRYGIPVFVNKEK